MTDDKQPKRKSGSTMEFWIAVGLVLGAGVGVAADNLAAGMGAGLVLGIAIGGSANRRSK